MTIRPGEQVCYVIEEHTHQVCTATIEKVGRLWITFVEHLERVQVSNRTSLARIGRHARIYPDRQAYEDALAADTVWREFRKTLIGLYQRPRGLGVDQIRAAGDVLGLELEGPVTHYSRTLALNSSDYVDPYEVVRIWTEREPPRVHVVTRDPISQKETDYAYAVADYNAALTHVDDLWARIHTLTAKNPRTNTR
jgi:hypothetical protein